MRADVESGGANLIIPTVAPYSQVSDGLTHWTMRVIVSFAMTLSSDSVVILVDNERKFSFIIGP